MQTPYFSLPSLPWDRFAEEENRFRLIIGVTLLIFIVVSFLIATVDLPQKVRQQAEVIPPRVAKLVTEKRLPPPPPPPPKVEEKKPELKPEPEKKVEKKPEPEKPKPEKKPEPKPKPQEKPKVTVKTPEQVQAERKQEAKQEAVKAAAVFDSLADLRDQTADVSSSLNTQQQALSASSVDGPAAATQRNLIGKAAAGGSGGVQVAKASTGGGGAGTVGGTGRLAKASTTAVASSIAKVADPVKQAAAKTGASGKARRTTEQIQLVFDRYKGQIYSIYRRALREDPGLEGTLLLKLQIQPNGTVTACSVVSSELGNPDLERKIVVKVKQLNFGNANVEVWSGNFPIKFFPS